MKRKLLILPLLVALILVSMIPTFASDQEVTLGVAVTDGVGTPGKQVRMMVSVGSVFADNVGIVIRTTDEKGILTLSEESGWLLEEEKLADVDVTQGIAVWSADAMSISGDIFEIVFDVSKEAQPGDVVTVNCEVQANWNEDKSYGNASSTVTIKNLAKISGTVTSYGEETDPVTVELVNGEEVVNTVELKDGANTYEFEAEQGTYVVRVKKTKHCPREYEVSMEDLTDKVQDAEIRLYGDVTGDGESDTLDAMEILKYFNGQPVISDTDLYMQKCADVTNDESIDTLDAMEVLKYFNGNQSVFDSME